MCEVRVIAILNFHVETPRNLTISRRNECQSQQLTTPEDVMFGTRRTMSTFKTLDAPTNVGIWKVLFVVFTRFLFLVILKFGHSKARDLIVTSAPPFPQVARCIRHLETTWYPWALNTEYGCTVPTDNDGHVFASSTPFRSSLFHSSDDTPACQLMLTVRGTPWGSSTSDGSSQGNSPFRSLVKPPSTQLYDNNIDEFPDSRERALCYWQSPG